MSSKKRRKKHKSQFREKSYPKFPKTRISDGLPLHNSGEPQTHSSDYLKEIRNLIAKGELKAAVNKAEKYHQDLGTEQSEAALKEAYTARIMGILDNGHPFEAKSLLDLAWERYHWPADHAFAEINAVICARSGNIDDLVAPLNNPSASPEVRTAVEKIVKTELVGLDALAGCKTLAPGHPLKTEALAAARAFSAVTSGPVDDEALTMSAGDIRSYSQGTGRMGWKKTWLPCKKGGHLCSCLFF